MNTILNFMDSDTILISNNIIIVLNNNNNNNNNNTVIVLNTNVRNFEIINGFLKACKEDISLTEHRNTAHSTFDNVIIFVWK